MSPGFWRYKPVHRTLETGDPSGWVAYIEQNQDTLKDPCGGGPLDPAWQELLENCDVHEHGDFALTRFHDPAADCGLSYCWNQIDDTLRVLRVDQGHGRPAAAAGGSRRSGTSAIVPCGVGILGREEARFCSFTAAKAIAAEHLAQVIASCQDRLLELRGASNYGEYLLLKGEDREGRRRVY
jgi:hypothetical protein